MLVNPLSSLILFSDSDNISSTAVSPYEPDDHQNSYVVPDLTKRHEIKPDGNGYVHEITFGDIIMRSRPVSDYDDLPKSMAVTWWTERNMRHPFQYKNIIRYEISITTIRRLIHWKQRRHYINFVDSDENYAKMTFPVLVSLYMGIYFLVR